MLGLGYNSLVLLFSSAFVFRFRISKLNLRYSLSVVIVPLTSFLSAKAEQLQSRFQLV